MRSFATGSVELHGGKTYDWGGPDHFIEPKVFDADVCVAHSKAVLAGGSPGRHAGFRPQFAVKVITLVQ